MAAASKNKNATNNSKGNSLSIDDKQFEFIKAEKEQRSRELLEYNIRQDKVIKIYITGLYAALGLSYAANAGKPIIDSLYCHPYYVVVAFFFSILNFAIIIYGTSQAAWIMSLAKYIYWNFDRKYLLGMQTWDDWETEIKGHANTTRGAAFTIWVFIVICATITFYCLVDWRNFWSLHRCWAILGICVDVLLLLYAVYDSITLGLLSTKELFHADPSVVEKKKKEICFIFKQWASTIVITIVVLVFACFVITNVSPNVDCPKL